MLKALADITQKIFLKEASGLQANKRPEINLNMVLLEKVTWHEPDLFSWYWSLRLAAQVLGNIQLRAVQHWFPRLKQHETRSLLHSSVLQTAQIFPDIPADIILDFLHVFLSANDKTVLINGVRCCTKMGSPSGLPQIVKIQKLRKI